jgi:putative transposase
MRIARAVAVGYPHNVIQRGNCLQSVFEDDKDYVQYLHWLEEYTKKYSLKIKAYCLMKDHVHFVCVPMKDYSLAKTFNTLHMRYSQYFNKKRGIKGRLWQSRFYSCILDERHTYEAIRHIENSPVRAKIAKEAIDYPWSSARSHITGEENPVLTDSYHLIKKGENWLAYLIEKEDENLIKNIQDNLKTGRPCGDKIFIRKIQELLSRELIPNPRGRPTKINSVPGKFFAKV